MPPDYTIYVLWPDKALESPPGPERRASAARRRMPMHLGAPYCGYVRRRRRLCIRASDMTETVRNSLKERLARGEVASSMTVRLSRSVEIAQVAATAGFDSLYIDLEHSSLSLETRARSAARR